MADNKGQRHEVVNNRSYYFSFLSSMDDIFFNVIIITHINRYFLIIVNWGKQLKLINRDTLM